MKKFLIAKVAPLILVVMVLTLATIGLPWFTGNEAERSVQVLADACLEHGYDASWSSESGLFQTHTQLTCLVKSQK